MDSNGQIQALQKELETKLGSLEKLMRGYRLKLYWYLGILTLSTLGTLSYQVTAAWQIHRIGSMFQEKIQSVDGRVDAILAKVEKLDPSAILGGAGGAVGAVKDPSAAKDAAAGDAGEALKGLLAKKKKSGGGP